MSPMSGVGQKHVDGLLRSGRGAPKRIIEPHVHHYCKSVGKPTFGMNLTDLLNSWIIYLCQKLLNKLHVVRNLHDVLIFPIFHSNILFNIQNPKENQRNPGSILPGAFPSVLRPRAVRSPAPSAFCRSESSAVKAASFG